MQKLMFLLVATAQAISVASTSSVTAAPANGVVIAKAVSADPLVEKAYPVRWRTTAGPPTVLAGRMIPQFIADAGPIVERTDLRVTNGRQA
jgi:hypothetical protein